MGPKTGFEQQARRTRIVCGRRNGQWTDGVGLSPVPLRLKPRTVILCHDVLVQCHYSEQRPDGLILKKASPAAIFLEVPAQHTKFS